MEEQERPPSTAQEDGRVAGRHPLSEQSVATGILASLYRNIFFPPEVQASLLFFTGNGSVAPLPVVQLLKTLLQHFHILSTVVLLALAVDSMR